MIRARDVSKTLGSRLVLDAVSMDLDTKHVVGIVGPNGAGKSTLLRVLAAETIPDRGDVTIDDRNAGQMGAAELARLRAMLPQSVDVAFDFSVHELVLLGRIAHEALSRSESDRLAADCLARMGLTDRAQVPVASLSGGERQRAHLARVLCQIGLGASGRFLLLDEPVSNQDPAWQLRVLDELRAVARRDVGVAVVLHDLNLAARACDRVVLLRGGRLLADGPPQRVLAPDALEAAFDVEAHVGKDPWGDGLPWISFRSKTAPRSSPEG